MGRKRPINQRKERMIMKLLTYEYQNSGARAGVKSDGCVVDLTELLGSDVEIKDIKMLMELYPDAVNEIRDALETGTYQKKIPLEDVKLLAPVLHPSTIRDSCMFEVHSDNAGKESAVVTPPLWYERPIFYYQNPNNVTGPEAHVRRKTGCTTLDYESEVAFVIGKRGFNPGIEEAKDYILGLTIFNDWSDRELCGKEAGFLGMHKSKDFATGLGPWIVTMDEFEDKMVDGKLNLSVKAWVTDVLTTDSTTSDMYWPLDRLFSVVSEDIEVLPGDIVGIGTVGLGCLLEQIEKFPFLKDGDRVTIQVEGIGTLRQYVAKPE